MKTILVITDRVGNGLTNGSQVFADALLRSLSREIDMHVITLQAEGAAPELHSLVLEPGADEQLSHGLIRGVDLDKCDLFYNLGGTSFSCHISLLLSQLRPAIPLVNHFQVNLATYAYFDGARHDTCLEEGLLQSTVAAKARRNIFTSFAELRAAGEQGWHCSEACVVPNGYVPAAGVVQPARPSAFTFFAAGRFSDYVKGADLLCRAFAGMPAGVSRLEIAADESRFLEILRGCAPESWAFRGWLDRDCVQQAMRAANCVVVPSRYEAFGLVAIEAMAAGAPVIAMAVGGLAEIVHHGVTGWLCPPEEGSLGLRLAMEQALSDPERTQWMGQNARRAVRREYSLSRVSQLVAKHLRNTAADNGRSLVNKWAAGLSPRWSRSEAMCSSVETVGDMDEIAG